MIAELLDLAADVFTNHGCNDFELAKLVPSVEERRALMREVETSLGNAKYFDPSGTYEFVEDWVLMRYFARKLREESK